LEDEELSDVSLSKSAMILLLSLRGEIFRGGLAATLFAE
jgi:hypothetical protein